MSKPTNSSMEITPACQTLALNQSNEDKDSLGLASRIPTIGLMTRKEWVIPPRPKPGRKPATDIPPTKRKAQNRAAQRAFRERRAARVGELEEQLEEVREEQQQREADLKKKIKQLETDVDHFNSELNSWKLRCKALDDLAKFEKRAKEAALAELANLRKSDTVIATDVISPSPRLFQRSISRRQQYSIFNSNTAPEAEVSTNIEDKSLIAGSQWEDFTSTNNSSCIEEQTKIDFKQNPTKKFRRLHSSPVENVPDKSTRQLERLMPLETDFTTQFSTKPIEVVSESLEQILSSESCGFCKDGTYCLCAEATASTASNKTNQLEEPAPKIDTCHSKMISHQQLAAQQDNLNLNGPGTCQQCQADPRSGIFCRSLSALQSKDPKIPDGCCGKQSNGSCCKLTMISEENSTCLSCADAYRTLSSHKNYDEANEDLGSWLGRLNAAPLAHPGRGPIEVEAASVMEVLKLFDRRFG